MDLTNIGQASPPEEKTPIVAKSEHQAPGENLKIHQNEQAKEFRKNHWTIDKAAEDGQIRAGEVDNEQAEFLKNTEMIPEGVKNNE